MVVDSFVHYGIWHFCLFLPIGGEYDQRYASEYYQQHGYPAGGYMRQGSGYYPGWYIKKWLKVGG